VVTSIYFFSNHLKSAKIKQSSFGKHQKWNIHILTENCQNIPIYGIDFRRRAMYHIWLHSLAYLINEYIMQ
jgi:hypothetical protein